MAMNVCFTVTLFVFVLNWWDHCSHCYLFAYLASNRNQTQDSSGQRKTLTITRQRNNNGTNKMCTRKSTRCGTSFRVLCAIIWCCMYFSWSHRCLNTWQNKLLSQFDLNEPQFKLFVAPPTTTTLKKLPYYYRK